MLTVAVLLFAVLAPGVAQQPATAVARGEWTADTRHTWRNDDGEPRAQHNLRSSAGDSRWDWCPVPRSRRLAGVGLQWLGRRRPVHLDARSGRFQTPSEAIDLDDSWAKVAPATLTHLHITTSRDHQIRD
jgi:hypothetical protein